MSVLGRKRRRLPKLPCSTCGKKCPTGDRICMECRVKTPTERAAIRAARPKQGRKHKSVRAVSGGLPSLGKGR